MHKLCVDKSVIGSPKNLVITDDGFNWTQDVPKDALHLTGMLKYVDDSCLDSLLKLSDASVNFVPPEKYAAEMLYLVKRSGVSFNDVLWHKVLPSDVYKSCVKNVIDKLMVSMVVAPFEYFKGTWVPGNAALRALERAKVDVSRLTELIALRSGNVSALESFMPDVTGQFAGFARMPIYDRFGTLTGRPSISSGPNILTLKKEHRNIIIPSDPERVVMYVDFSALEPRVLLYEVGGRGDDADLYGVIGRECGLTRDITKNVVISLIYGKSLKTMRAELPMSEKQFNRLVAKVKRTFGISTLLKRIKSQFLKMGKIVNRYGRPINVDDPHDHVMINYYAQSTAADVALMGFNVIRENALCTGIAVRPLYYLYDAMIFEVNAADVEKIALMTAVHVPGYVQNFYVKYDVIS